MRSLLDALKNKLTGRTKMEPFFQKCYRALADSPNGSAVWLHSLPLPNGDRINGNNPDKDLQFKMWGAMQIAEDQGLAGKKVLDIGANDGFFTVAAIIAGAAKVTAVDRDWSTWPQNIHYACQVWDVAPEIVNADFLSHGFDDRYDVVFLLGVLYHVEDVFGCMRKLRRLLVDGGVVYVEAQMSQIQSDLPIFEYASDIYPTVAIQDKGNLSKVGISNCLFPNEHAIRNLAHSYDFDCESLNGPHNAYSREYPFRQFFKLSKRSSAA